MTTAQAQALFARQAILDDRRRIVGHHLALAEHPDDGARPSAAAATLHEIAAGCSGARKRAFVLAGAAIVDEAMCGLLEPRNTVLVLPGLAPDALRPLAPRLKELRSRGYGIAVGLGVPDPAWETVLTAITHFALDAAHAGVLCALPEVRRLRRYGARLIATSVQSRAQFDSAREAGVDLFQGHFFLEPETLSARGMVPAYGIVLQALNMVHREADLPEIEAVLRQDPALSFKLLRYINSAAFGLTREIVSLADAIRLLGYRQVSRWLSLVLMTARIDDGTRLALAQTAATRGRLLELLANAAGDRDLGEQLFIAGLFSLLPAMLEQPMERILGSLQLPQTLTDALLCGTGPLAPYLELARACEAGDRIDTGDAATLHARVRSLALEPATVNRAHLEALRFAEIITA